MAKKRVLTWHGPTKRWKKQINGVVYYFGYGTSEKDVASYRAAEDRFLEKRRRIERITPFTVRFSEATILQAAERFLQSDFKGMERGEIGAQHFFKRKRYVEHFVEWVDGDRRLSRLGELDLDDYRDHVLTLPKSEVTGKPISKSTAKTMLASVHKFMRYLWEGHFVEEEFRNLRGYTHVVMPAPNVKCFTNDELKQIWILADRRTKCWIALALNCGYGQKDISDLKVGEVNLVEGIIERKRSKTGVAQRHKLWDVTKELLVEFKPEDNTAETRYFSNVNGTSLLTEAIVDDKLKKSDAIKCAFWRLLRQAKVGDGRSFYSLRKTAASEIERINSLVTSMFLAHSERAMKKHYAQPNWEALDQATTEMGRRFEFLRS